MTRTVFVTGAAGFIGAAVARQLRARGDDVVAIVRDPASATESAGDRRAARPGRPRLRRRDPGRDERRRRGHPRRGHLPRRHPGVRAAGDVRGQRRRDRARPRRRHRRRRSRASSTISTVNVFGNTHGRVVDETYQRDLARRFPQLLRRDQVPRPRRDRGARSRPAPRSSSSSRGPVYGPNDHSAIGAQLQAAYDGTLPYIGVRGDGDLADHVDDLAAGIIAALDRGRIGEAYVMAGENMALARRDAGLAAAAGGASRPRLSIPTAVLRIGSRLAPHAGGAFGLPPDLREIIAVRGRRDLLGEQRQGRDASSATPRAIWRPAPGCVRPTTDRLPRPYGSS